MEKNGTMVVFSGKTDIITALVNFMHSKRITEPSRFPYLKEEFYLSLSQEEEKSNYPTNYPLLKTFSIGVNFTVLGITYNIT